MLRFAEHSSRFIRDNLASFFSFTMLNFLIPLSYSHLRSLWYPSSSVPSFYSADLLIYSPLIAVLLTFSLGQPLLSMFPHFPPSSSPSSSSTVPSFPLIFLLFTCFFISLLHLFRHLISIWFLIPFWHPSFLPIALWHLSSPVPSFPSNTLPAHQFRHSPLIPLLLFLLSPLIPLLLNSTSFALIPPPPLLFPHSPLISLLRITWFFFPKASLSKSSLCPHILALLWRRWTTLKGSVSSWRKIIWIRLL
jgi:hypothetical protein